MKGAEQFGHGRLNEYVDAERLVDEIGLDEDEIEWRKEFIDFDETDVRNLEGFADLFEAHADEIADSFYDHVTNYEATRAVMDRSPKSVDQLEETQRAYLVSLAAGEYDEEYFRDRARIGKLHELLDMPINQYIGQYNVYYSLLLGLVTDRLHDRLSDTVETVLHRERLGNGTVDVDPDRLTRSLYADVESSLDELHSLLKLLNLDLQVAVDTYFQSRIDDLELERDRFAALFENVPTPVVAVHVTDDGIRVEEVNAAFEELFGYTAAELSDRDFEQFLSPPGAEPSPLEDRGMVERIRSNSESELAEAEVTLETQFGRREFVRVSAPVDRPTLDGLEYAFYIDVTDQKQRQERLQVLSRVLRHDIRNKLNVVKGFTTTLSDTLADGDRDQRIAHIQHSTDELLETSEKIHEVERLIAGDAEQRPIRVSDLVETAFDSVRGNYPECAFAISSGGETWISGTETLAIALEEVIENGAEHNDAANPSVRVSVTDSLDDRYVEIRVADNGPGIPPAEYEVLTGERERSQTDHTSGLGLWVVNWIVTQAGGSLRFSANTPRGSVVEIRLPRAQPPD